MNLDRDGDSETRFAAYVDGLAGVIGHADRARPLRDYCTGLLLPGERKSVEPMAARTAPARTAAQHHPRGCDESQTTNETRRGPEHCAAGPSPCCRKNLRHLLRVKRACSNDFKGSTQRSCGRAENLRGLEIPGLRGDIARSVSGSENVDGRA
jgi:hypothetical protein